MSHTIDYELQVNGGKIACKAAPQASLLNVLRANYIYDVKCGCEEGDCGACTVLLDGVAVKSCITLAAACEGRDIWTNKGLGYNDQLTAELQAAFVECGSIQCGFCTPGMIVAGVSYIKAGGRADRKAIKAAMSGNLCRCTGYVKIVDAIYKVAKAHEMEART